MTHLSFWCRGWCCGRKSINGITPAQVVKGNALIHGKLFHLQYELRSALPWKDIEGYCRDHVPLFLQGYF